MRRRVKKGSYNSYLMRESRGVQTAAGPATRVVHRAAVFPGEDW